MAVGAIFILCRNFLGLKPYGNNDQHTGLPLEWAIEMLTLQAFIHLEVFHCRERLGALSWRVKVDLSRISLTHSIRCDEGLP